MNFGIANHVINGGLERLLRKWADFVEECRTGYSLGIEDYINDLDGRSIVQRLIDSVNEKRLKDKLNSFVKSEDNIFKNLLIQRNKCITLERRFGLDLKLNKRKYFWYWGVIKNAKGELLEDFKKEGFVKVKKGVKKQK